MNDGPKPDGLLRSELLRRQAGCVAYSDRGLDRDAVLAVRDSGRPPAALILLDELGEQPHTVLIVEQMTCMSLARDAGEGMHSD